MPHSGKTMTFATDLVPQEDDTYNLGTDTQRWKLNGISPGNGRVFYGTCATAAGTTLKEVICASYDKQLTNGDMLIVKFSNTNSGAVGSLQITVKKSTSDTAGTDAKNIKRLYNTTGASNLAAAAELHKDAVNIFVYNGTYWIMINGDYNNTYYYTSIYCTTAAATAEKIGTISSSHLGTAGRHFQVFLYYTNTAKSALTLNISNQGARPIYINGEPSSASNYTLPSGCYIIYDDGTNYYFRTDGKLTGDIVGNAATATTAVYAATTEDVTNNLYLLGVTSSDTTTLKRDTSAILNKATLTLGAANNEGSLKLFSSGANSKAHIIKGTSITNDITHTFPNSTGWVATGGNGSDSGVGTSNIPIYLKTDGTLEAVRVYDWSGSIRTLQFGTEGHNGSDLITKNTLAYWNGAYTTNSEVIDDETIYSYPSNLRYCNKGEFGDVVTYGINNTLNPNAATLVDVPSSAALNRKVLYSQNEPSVTNADLGMFWFKPADITIEDLKCLVVTVLKNTQSEQTFDNTYITGDMAVIKCDVLTPSAQVGNITWTTDDGHITLAGTFSTSTYINLYLMRANQEDQ